MKFLLSFLVGLLIYSSAKSQDCFGEFESNVSSIACINYELGFELSKNGAIASETPQPFFAVNNSHGSRDRIQSFYMIDKKGTFFNIHQHGFKVGDMIIEVDYKIVSLNRLVDLAIVIDGQPVFHKIADISEKYSDNIRVINGVGVYSGRAERFAVLIRNSDLVGFQMNTVQVSIIE